MSSSASPVIAVPSSSSAGISSVPVLRRISSWSAGSAGTCWATNGTPGSVSRWRTQRECGHHSAW